MALGITKTLEVFEDLGILAVTGVAIAKEFKHGIGIGAILKSIEKLHTLSNTVQEILRDVPGALPELMDLDAAESEKIGKASYELVKKIINAVTS